MVYLVNLFLNLLLKDKQKYQVFDFLRGKNKSGREDFSFTSINISDEIILKKT
jgi:dTDP-4-dehydrorhamnose reductase